MSNWYAGQKVVCIKTHSERATIAGQPYVIYGMMTCSCGSTWLNVGVPAKFIGTKCSICGAYTTDGIWWQGSKRFRPLDPLEEQIERIESEGCPEPELQEA